MSDPYSTHLPVLRALPKTFPIRKIIEFGCGNYSTPLLLDRTIFPLVDRFVSLESNLDFAREITSKVQDPRFSMVTASEEELLEIATKYAPADLVFVDGQRQDMRVKTALAAGSLAPLVVLHDAENYMDVTSGFKHHFLFDKLLPWTIVLSNTHAFFGEIQ